MSRKCTTYSLVVGVEREPSVLRRLSCPSKTREFESIVVTSFTNEFHVNNRQQFETLQRRHSRAIGAGRVSTATTGAISVSVPELDFKQKIIKHYIQGIEMNSSKVIKLRN
jgi:hypothetical protein